MVILFVSCWVIMTLVHVMTSSQTCIIEKNGQLSKLNCFSTQFSKRIL